jgi:dihydrofolate synthase/folylpolyglutamate synthase
MNYKETIDYLFARLPMYQRTGKSAYKATLENTWKFDRYFKSPHKKYKTVHVGGTNGKGSVCHMLASVLQNAGYTTGLHTSPHLFDFRERIKVNGIPVPENYVVEFVKKHSEFFERTRPSFFEMSVFMAFNYFASRKVDIAIIEVGLGGRLDSTNVINPLFSVITNIGHDHMNFLGNTLEKIAHEKAGIIKEKIPVVIGESDPNVNHVFTSIADAKSSPIIYADQQYSSEYSLISADNMQVFNIEKDNQICYPGLKTDLLGVYQGKNLLTALTCIDLLRDSGFSIDNIDIYKGMKRITGSTGFYGRWQVKGYYPKIVCDTAHNPEGLKSVINQIINTPYKDLYIIIGFVRDKNIDDLLKLFPEDAFYYFTRADIPRALDENIILEKSKRYNLKGKAYGSVGEAFNSARSSAGRNDMIFIGGSTFVVADFLKLENG